MSLPCLWLSSLIRKRKLRTTEEKTAYWMGWSDGIQKDFITKSFSVSLLQWQQSTEQRSMKFWVLPSQLIVWAPSGTWEVLGADWEQQLLCRYNQKLEAVWQEKGVTISSISPLCSCPLPDRYQLHRNPGAKRSSSRSRCQYRNPQPTPHQICGLGGAHKLCEDIMANQAWLLMEHSKIVFADQAWLFLLECCMYLKKV